MPIRTDVRADAREEGDAEAIAEDQIARGFPAHDVGRIAFRPATDDRCTGTGLDAELASGLEIDQRLVRRAQIADDQERPAPTERHWPRIHPDRDHADLAALRQVDDVDGVREATRDVGTPPIGIHDQVLRIGRHRDTDRRLLDVVERHEPELGGELEQHHEPPASAFVAIAGQRPRSVADRQAPWGAPSRETIHTSSVEAEAMKNRSPAGSTSRSVSMGNVLSFTTRMPAPRSSVSAAAMRTLVSDRSGRTNPSSRT